MTLKQFAAKPETIPAITSWYLADLSEARGKQELFTRQTPQRLKTLREHALIESAVSSNRIEGVTVDQDRILPVILGKSHLRDRDEEEVRGYRNALKLIHERASKLTVSEDIVREFHRLARGEIWDAGKYKEKDGDIIERHPDGTERVRFQTVLAAQTPDFMRQLVERWDGCLKERWVHPLIALAAFNLDFLCVHPFRDGNGRVSRLLLLLQCYHLGYEVGRYISLERLIEQNKERYYENLGAEFPVLARGPARPLALYQLPALHPQDRLPRVRGTRGKHQEPARRQDRAGRVGDQRLFRRVHAVSTGTRLPRRQPGHGATCAPGAEKIEENRVHRPRPRSAVAEKR